MTARLRAAGLYVALAAAAGCGGGAAEPTECAPGQVSACACGGGRRSTRICGQSGKYGACLCGDAPGSDAAVDGPPRDAAGDAPPSVPDAPSEPADAGATDRAPEPPVDAKTDAATTDAADGAAPDVKAIDGATDTSPYTGPGALTWVQRSKGNGADQSFTLAVTTSGALVTGGHFNGSMTFAPDSAAPKSFTSKGQDLWLSRSGADGTFAWARTAGNTIQSVVSAVAPAPGDDVYVGGTAWAFADNPVILGAGEASQTTFTNIGTYFARYRADGSLVWAKVQKNGGAPRRIVPAPDGGFYAVGDTGLTYATFGVGEPRETKLISRSVPSSEPMFVARFSPEGQLVWVRTLGAIHPEAALMADGGLAVFGMFGGTAGVFQGGAVPDVSLTPDWFDLFVASYSPAGDLRWVKQVKGLPQTDPQGATVLTSGDLVVSGSCHPYKDGTAQQGDAAHTQAIFGPGEANETKLTCSDFDLFTARFTPAGALVWAKAVPGGYPEIRNLAPLSDGGFVMASKLRTSQVVFDPGTAGALTVTQVAQYGNLVVSWHRADGTARAARIVATGAPRVLGVSVLSGGSVVLAGAFSSTTIFGPLDATKVSYTKTGGGYENIVGEDMFVARLAP